MFRPIRIALLLGLFFVVTMPALSDTRDWEYQVVILKGLTAGGIIEKQSDSIFIDKKKTEALNTLTSEGWEVLAVIGAPGADDTVYLRRARTRP